MSNIDQQLQKLRDREKQLDLEKRKIEFLNHILDSAKEYNHKAFADVKDEVVSILEKLTESAVDSIISKVVVAAAPITPETSVVAPVTQDSALVKALTPKKPEDGLGPNDKLNFAMDNRHLAGKIVTIANDKNMTVKGKVVGLDAPYVLVATDTGPVIKVPLEKLSVV